MNKTLLFVFSWLFCQINFGQLVVMKRNNTINLSKKGLTEIPEEVFDYKEVKVLKLFGNHLSKISHRIAELENLEELYIGKNDLDSLPPEIGQLKKLRILSIQYNQLSKLPNEIGQLQNLEQLWLNQNKLDSLPTSIGNLKNLTKIQLNFNQLKCLPKEIGECSALRFVYLDRNYLENLPEEMGNLENMKELYLTNCGFLVELPESLCKLRYFELLVIDRQIVVPTCLIVHQTNRLKIVLEN